MVNHELFLFVTNSYNLPLQNNTICILNFAIRTYISWPVHAQLACTALLLFPISALWTARDLENTHLMQGYIYISNATQDYQPGSHPGSCMINTHTQTEPSFCKWSTHHMARQYKLQYTTPVPTSAWRIGCSLGRIACRSPWRASGGSLE